MKTHTTYYFGNINTPEDKFCGILVSLLVRKWYNKSMEKPLSKKILKYTVIFEPAEEGGYVASVPALPGCLSQGETFEEARVMIRDAMQGYLEVLKEEKQEIPREQSDVVVTQISVQNPFVSL